VKPPSVTRDGATIDRAVDGDPRRTDCAPVAGGSERSSGRVEAPSFVIGASVAELAPSRRSGMGTHI
jgi:hypothetical protein